MKTISISLSELETLSVINALASASLLLSERNLNSTASSLWQLRDHICNLYEAQTES